MLGGSLSAGCWVLRGSCTAASVRPVARCKLRASGCSVTEPGGFTLKHKGFYLALRGSAEAVAGFLPAVLTVSRSRQQLRPRPCWPFAHPELENCFPPGQAPAPAAEESSSFLVLQVLALFSTTILSDSFNLPYCCGKYASRERFSWKMLKWFDLHCSLPLKTRLRT